VLILTSLPGSGESLAIAIRETIWALARAYAVAMRSSPLPPLYASGVRYRPEPQAGSGLERWDHPWEVLERGWGDCDDLVLWRLAELHAAGETTAAPVVAWRGAKMHVLIRRAAGHTEDPSLILLEKERQS
jgi:hypothetical protein